jgi:hypothetical protein
MGIRGGRHPSETLPAGCILVDALRDAGQDISDYESSIRELYLGSEPLPDFGMICARVQEVAGLL